MNLIFEKLKQYNRWDGQIYPAGYKRSEYLDRIVKSVGKKLIKVMVGQRRVGKSYILRQLMNFLVLEKKVNPNNIFYLNKEFIAFEEIRTALELEQLYLYYKDELKVSGKGYIFLDEIQNIENWESFVNSYSQDFTNEYELFITGSNSNLLSGELATLLSGRYIEFEIFPFSLYELADYKNEEVNKSMFLNYIETSGLPEMIDFEKEELQRHYVESLKNTIILRDIIRRNNIKDVTLLDDIFKFISTNIGNLTSITNIVKYFKSKLKRTNYDTISTYIEYLKNTYIIHEVERYNLRSKQTLGGERKYYLNDLAFKNYLIGFYPDDIGYHLENYVFTQLKRMGYKVMVGVFNDKEIDFVAQKPEKTIYVQVAYLLHDTKIVKREFQNLLAIKDNHEKMVVSLDDNRFSNFKGIRIIKPWELK